jgi:outer membrane protein assembly factor BamB
MTLAAWSTCSASRQAEYSLVLNPDDTLAIMDENGRVTWKSDTDETCLIPARDPLVLLRSTVNYNDRAVRYGEEVSIWDGKSNSDVCLVQQGDGNFRVVRASGCGSNAGTLLFHSELSKELANGETYFTVLQRDGNLVTRKEFSGDWAWSSCSSQGDIPQDWDEYVLVLLDDNSLSILSSTSGETIWNSMSDPSCVA